MNVNLKNASQLKEHYNNKPDQAATPIEREVSSAYQKINNKRNQKDLFSFMEPIKKNSNPTPISKIFIKISSKFPMRYGLRKGLIQEEINFEITESDIHICMFNKIIIQIFNPQDYSEANFKEINDFVENECKDNELVIGIFDFIHYQEKVENGKRLKKQNLIRLSKKNGIRNIIIDSSDELVFTVKNIYDVNIEKV